MVKRIVLLSGAKELWMFWYGDKSQDQYLHCTSGDDFRKNLCATIYVKNVEMILRCSSRVALLCLVAHKDFDS